MNPAAMWGTPFQRIALLALGMALVYEILGLVGGRSRRGLAALRIVVWLGSAITIAQPQIVQSVANSIGIRRGADLVVYLLALAFAAASFFFYSRYLRLEQQLVELVRELAILRARRHRGPDSTPDDVSPLGPSNPEND